MLMREVREVVPGPIAMVRLGTCGIVHPGVNEGDIIVPDKSIMVQQNFFDKTSGPFLISEPVPCCAQLNELVAKCIRQDAGSVTKVVTGGIDASTDSFYSSQGKRED